MSDMTKEKSIDILKSIKAGFETDEWMKEDIEALEKGIESLQKIEKIEKILFQDYKHRDCGSEDSWYLEDIMNILKENKQ